MRHLVVAGFVAFALAAALPNAGVGQTPAQPATSNDQMPMKRMMMDKRHGASMHMHRSGHRMDTIADKLNACQLQPQAERQLCIDRAVSP